MYFINMLFLCGDNVISVGTSKHKRFVTLDNVSTVEVAVRAMTLTDVGIRLRLPISIKSVLTHQSSQCASSTIKATCLY